MKKYCIKTVYKIDSSMYKRLDFDCRNLKLQNWCHFAVIDEVRKFVTKLHYYKAMLCSL